MLSLIEDFTSVEGKTVEAMYYGTTRDGDPNWGFIEIKFTDGTLLVIKSEDEVSAYIGSGE